MPILGVLTDSVLESESPLALIAGLHATCRPGSRAFGRVRFPYDLLLTPLDQDQAEKVRVRGKSLSWGGIGIEHTQPLLSRKVLLEAADPRLVAMGLDNFQVEATLRRCRFLAIDHYETGGSIRWISEPILARS